MGFESYSFESLFTGIRKCRVSRLRAFHVKQEGSAAYVVICPNGLPRRVFPSKPAGLG